jgi:hypothetical protein
MVHGVFSPQYHGYGKKSLKELKGIFFLGKRLPSVEGVYRII